MFSTAIVLALAAAGAEPQVAVDASRPLIEGPIVMTMGQIKTYNEGLASTDPHFIRCTKDAPTGSWVPKRVCRTKGEWDRLAAIAERDARESQDDRVTHTTVHN